MDRRRGNGCEQLPGALTSDAAQQKPRSQSRSLSPASLCCIPQSGPGASHQTALHMTTTGLPEKGGKGAARMRLQCPLTQRPAVSLQVPTVPGVGQGVRSRRRCSGGLQGLKPAIFPNTVNGARKRSCMDSSKAGAAKTRTHSCRSPPHHLKLPTSHPNPPLSGSWKCPMHSCSHALIRVHCGLLPCAAAWTAQATPAPRPCDAACWPLRCPRRPRRCRSGCRRSRQTQPLPRAAATPCQRRAGRAAHRRRRSGMAQVPRGCLQGCHRGHAAWPAATTRSRRWMSGSGGAQRPPAQLRAAGSPGSPATAGQSACHSIAERRRCCTLASQAAAQRTPACPQTCWAAACMGPRCPSQAFGWRSQQQVGYLG